MQDTDYIVDVIFVNGQPRVFALADDLLDLADFVVEIDTDDFVVRNHDIVDGYFFQVEDAEQHLLIPAGYSAARLVHDGSQFLPGKGLQFGISAADSEQEQHAIRRDIGQPDDRIGNFEQRVIDHRGREGEPLRVQRRQRLGRRFREYQHDERQNQGTERDGRFATHFESDEGNQ